MVAHVELRPSGRDIGLGDAMRPFGIVDGPLRNGALADQLGGALALGCGIGEVGLGPLQFGGGEIARRSRRLDRGLLFGPAAQIEEGGRRRLDARDLGPVRRDFVAGLRRDPQEVPESGA